MAVDNTLIESQGEAPEAYKAVNPNHPRLAIKHGKSFLLMDTEGFLSGGQEQGYGLYLDDTRFLRKWDMRLNGQPLFLLNGNTDEGFEARFIYTNHGVEGIADQSLKIERSLVIGDVLAEKVSIENFSATPVEVELSVDFAADFIDMFEVRGAVRAARGVTHSAHIDRRRKRVTFSYTGLDGLTRATTVVMRGRRPERLDDAGALFRLAVAPRSVTTLEFSILTATGCKESFAEAAPAQPLARKYDVEARSARRMYRRFLKGAAKIETENLEFNTVLERAIRDFYVLLQETPAGRAIAAGVPWFAEPFGRDGAIAMLQAVGFFPEPARDEIVVLGAYQGTEYDIVTAQAPGKILHEMRFGEMARMKEIAFRPYYGTVDATQLWLMLIAEYVEWTGDLAFARRLWPNVLAALDFLARATGNGYITYGGIAGEALTNQGWKDSYNSIVYSDGTLAKAPIAVCEAQGYLYSAWMGMARIAALLGEPRLAVQLEQKAADLKARFRQDFWMEDERFVAIALDGDGRQCDVVSSNPGHLIGTGILSREQELQVAARLMETDMFSGWGIRTLASSERAYQPMDYQVGSVWPHDNGFAVEGMLKIGRREDAHRVMKALFDVARNLADRRLPELFCGFDRDEASVPVKYPVACVPQAWSAGCVLHMLKACFGIVPDASGKTVRIVNPSVPKWLGRVTVRDLPVAGGRLDLEYVPLSDGTTHVNVLRRRGGLKVVVELHA